MTRRRHPLPKRPRESPDLVLEDLVAGAVVAGEDHFAAASHDGIDRAPQTGMILDPEFRPSCVRIAAPHCGDVPGGVVTGHVGRVGQRGHGTEMCLAEDLVR